MYGRFFSPQPKAPSRVPNGQEELLLYSSNRCPYCIRVFSHIESLGIEVAIADTGSDSEARNTLRNKTGRSTVPCLFIDGEPLFESRDIMAWLTEYVKVRGQK